MIGKRRHWRISLLLVSVAAFCPCAFFGFWAAAAGGSDKGSPELAQEWKVELARYQTPQEAKAKNPNIIVVEFANGEWVFGRSQSSHGMWKRGGGTTVVKDSKGQIRAFFGHVCGDGQLGANWGKPDLAGYYKETLAVAGANFTEYQYP